MRFIFSFKHKDLLLIAFFIFGRLTWVFEYFCWKFGNKLPIIQFDASIIEDSAYAISAAPSNANDSSQPLAPSQRGTELGRDEQHNLSNQSPDRQGDKTQRTMGSIV